MKKFTPLFLASLTLISSINMFMPMNAAPQQCDDVKVVWANGSGADINGTDNNYNDFKNAVQHELMRTRASFSFYELGTSAHGGYQYPAASVGVRSLDELWRTIQAAAGAGESYEYGASALEGAMEMREYIKEVVAMCPETKFVLGGLSQGGQVVSWAIQDIDPQYILYAATFGDPKLYLPEGKYGKNSSACRSIYYNNYSEYRAFVPDCEAYEGILKARNPYQPAGYSGKLGAWCSYHDVMCSSHINFLDLWNDSLAPHGSYGQSYFAYDLYGDAAKIIRQKVAAHVQTKYNSTGVDNVVFIVDKTKYASEYTPRLEDMLYWMSFDVMNDGGKVAVYFVEGDEANPELQMICGFSDSAAKICDSEIILEAIEVRIAGYDMETLTFPYPGWSLETDMIYNSMSGVEWENGANKSMVLLTNASFWESSHSVEDIVNLSKSIDPVNIYSLSPDDVVDEYADLTYATGGKSYGFTADNEKDLAAMIRDDDTVRSGWEAPDTNEYKTATISDVETKVLDDNSLKVSYKTENAKAVGVFLNDAMVALAGTESIILTDINYAMQNDLMLVPFPEIGYAGESVETKIDVHQGETTPTDVDTRHDGIKAPNSGVANSAMSGVWRWWWSKEMEN